MVFGNDGEGHLQWPSQGSEHFLHFSDQRRKRSCTRRELLAHSVPADELCSVFWPSHLELLTGASLGNQQPQRCFAAVHGRMASGKTQCLDIQNKGLKNIAQNLLVLPPDHGMFCNGSGAQNLIIVPIVNPGTAARRQPRKPKKESSSSCHCPFPMPWRQLN